MPRSSRSNPVDLVVDHEYEARISTIKVGTSAGSALGTAFGNYLASGNDEKVGAGIMKGLKDKADCMESPIRKVGTKKKTVAVPDAPKKASTTRKSKAPPKAIPMQKIEEL